MTDGMPPPNPYPQVGGDMPILGVKVSGTFTLTTATESIQFDTLEACVAEARSKMFLASEGHICIDWLIAALPEPDFGGRGGGGGVAPNGGRN